MEPGSTVTGHAERMQPGSLGFLGPGAAPGHTGVSVLLVCVPFSALLFLSLFSASLQHKTISNNPSWSQAPSLPAACMGLCPSCQAELLGINYGRQSFQLASLGLEVNLKIFTKCLQEQETRESQQLYVHCDGFGHRVNNKGNLNGKR